MQTVFSTSESTCIIIWLDTLVGPLSNGTRDFDPNLDLELYVDGTPSTLQGWVYDYDLNRFRLYLTSFFTPSSLVQVVHRMPTPPFSDTTGKTLYSFSQIAVVSSYSLSQSPAICLSSSYTSTGDVYLLWTVRNVPNIEIVSTGDSFNTGIISSTAGVYPVLGGFPHQTTLVATAYDSNSNPISVNGSPLTATCTINPNTNVFYIDPLNGNDSNNGLNPATPWQTLAPFTYPPGATVRILVNGVWVDETAAVVGEGLVSSYDIPVEDISGPVSEY